MPKVSKIERAELYKESLIQLFLNKFVSGELEKLTPVYDPKQGYKYSVVEAVVGEPSLVNEFLNRLYKAGILVRELYDKVVRCPSCGSANVSIRYCCPHCGSFDIKKSALIEHVECGYIDVEEKFREEDKLVCPRCKKQLTKPDVDYRRAGVWCTCNECGRSFDIPVPSHFCRDCHRKFTFENCAYEDVYSYSLSEEARKEAAFGGVMIAPIREFLREHGFKVETPGFLKGKSGASHMFDITAFRKGQAEDMAVIDLASTEDVVSEQPIIAMFAKIFDVEPNKAYLVAVPKVSDNGKKMAKLYKIELIEAKDQKEAIRALKDKMLKKQ
ncbi:MAG: zinc ribbon domain-containing protein [Thermoproteota archaeon]|nr:zinc ribbon domain-containing protein [Thermoproteota archaeon]